MTLTVVVYVLIEWIYEAMWSYWDRIWIVWGMLWIKDAWVEWACDCWDWLEGIGTKIGTEGYGWTDWVRTGIVIFILLFEF